MTQAVTSLNSAVCFNAPKVQRLSSGLTIVAEQMPVDAVNLSLWLGVGSAVEADSINGLAHYLEHMIFKGTKRLKTGDFERLIEQRGAITNAATSQDYTHYYITTAPHDFAELAPLQIEVVLNAVIPDAEFERERSVILEEIRRANDNPRRRTFYKSMQAAFDRLPYRRPVLGPTSVIEALTAQQMRDFHSTWYRPQSMTAVAVGNLPVDQLIDIVARSFEHANAERSPAPDAPLPPLPNHTTEPAFSHPIRWDEVDESLQQARLVMMWRVPGMEDLHQTYALDILASVLGHGRTSRLFRELREERKLVSSISVSNMTYTTQGVFYITAHLQPEHLEETEQVIVGHMRRLQQELVSEFEINRIRTLVANRYIFGNETPSDRAGLYGYYRSVVGDLAPALDYPQRVRAISVADLQAAAQQHLSPEAYAIVTLRPKG